MCVRVGMNSLVLFFWCLFFSPFLLFWAGLTLMGVEKRVRRDKPGGPGRFPLT